MQYSIEVGDPNEPDVAALLAASEANSHKLYPPEGVHMLDVDDLLSSSVRFLVARSVEGIAEGCGAIVISSNHFAEVKRMYVLPNSRGKGVGSFILQNLEKEALNSGLCMVRLETGPLQHEAISLYRRFGYCDRGPFGTYKESPWSLFMEKKLDYLRNSSQDEL